jgi:hypothetical protein
MYEGVPKVSGPAYLLWDGNKLRGFENRILRIFRPKREVTDGWENCLEGGAS